MSEPYYCACKLFRPQWRSTVEVVMSGSNRRIKPRLSPLAVTGLLGSPSKITGTSTYLGISTAYWWPTPVWEPACPLDDVIFDTVEWSGKYAHNALVEVSLNACNKHNWYLAPYSSKNDSSADWFPVPKNILNIYTLSATKIISVNL